MTDALVKKDEEIPKEQKFNLEANSELRIEIEDENETTLILKSGTAEIFGSEILLNRPINLSPGSKLAVLTWHGCELILKGALCDVAYISKETPAVCYVNTHAVLERMRERASIESTRGPRVMVVGPTDVGKTTLCVLLLNYAIRMGRKPVYVDLDVGQGSISVPGTLGAIQVERTIDVEESSLYSSHSAPIAFHFGHNSPGDNIPLYCHLITRLAAIVEKKCRAQPKVDQSGIIINTCGWVKQQGYQAITHAAQAFEVDIVIVIDQERVYTELKRDMPPFVKVVMLPKSGGVVTRSKHYRSSVRDKRVREYFYGRPKHAPFYPHSFEVKFSDVTIFRVGSTNLPDSCLPLGMKVEDERTKLVPIVPSFNLLHHLAALSMAKTETEADVLESNVAGFVCITEIKMEKDCMTILSPQPRPLPFKILLISEIQFIDYT